MAYLWSRLVLIPVGAIFTIAFGIVSRSLHLAGAADRKLIEVARLWARALLFFGGVKVVVEGLEKIDPNGRYVFVLNHLSYIDTPVYSVEFRCSFGFLPRKGCSRFLFWAGI
jgi:1-acyl-sn-glycerol-3-phosphate acyltransferase